MELQAGNHKILPAKTGKLLGCEINGNGSTISEIVNSKQSLIRQLTSGVKDLTMSVSSHWLAKIYLNKKADGCM